MSFQQGLSGLSATSTQLDVIGNNISNANTTGFKSATAEFAGLYAAAINGGGGNAVGIGTTVSTVAQQFTQGSITTTGNPLDLAINGGGFFQVASSAGTTQYTRDGQFNVNSTGYIVDAAGDQLMGYPADAAGKIAQGQMTALQLPTGNVAPQATSKISMSMNLDSAAAVTAPTAPAAQTMNPTDPTTYNNATSVTVYDAQGNAVPLTYYFQNAGKNSWNVYASANGADVGSGGSGAPSPIGTLAFSSTGTSPTLTLASGGTGFTIPASAGTAANPVTGAAATPATLAIPITTLDLSSSTEFGSAFGVTAMTQNGYASGQLTGVAIGNNGIITANYSNGQSQPAGQVAIANFRNPQGLQQIGNNDWIATVASGAPVVGAPGTGNLGALQSGALESSNVGLTSELVNLITAQRNYQANAQTIKAQDTILQTLVQGL